MDLGDGSSPLAGSEDDRSADSEDGVEVQEYQRLKESAESIGSQLSEQGDEDGEMGAPDGEDSSAEVKGDEQEDEAEHEQHPSSGETLPTPQSATFPDSATAAPVFAPPPPPSTRITRPTRSSRRHSLSSTPNTSLPTPTGFAASKGGPSLAIAVTALSSTGGAVTDWANSPQSNPFNYSSHSSAPQPSPHIPSLSPMTISNPYASVSGEGQASNYAPSSCGSGPVTPISPYTFPAPPQAQAGGWEDGGTRSVFGGRAQSRQSRPSSSQGFAYAEGDSHARSRLKRTHETANAGSYGASSLAGAFAASTEKSSNGQRGADREGGSPALWDAQSLARFYVPPTGPESEVEHAARMATVAASKSGLGAGAFVYKVYHMLLDPPSQQYARFTDNGKSFIVFDQNGLSKHILPRHSKHSNFASFVRQLNMYSFHKVNRVSRGQTKAQLESLPSEFAHPLFEKGKPHQLEQIKRRGPESEQQRGQRPRSTSGGETEGFYERRETRSVSGALMGRRYAEEDADAEDVDAERGGVQSDDEYEEERKEEGSSPAGPNRMPTSGGSLDAARVSRQIAPSDPSSYPTFRPTGPPSLLAAEARATYSASQDPYSTAVGAVPAFARPPPHPSQARRQQPQSQPASHPHSYALHTIASFGPPPSASIPLPERVAILEHQRAELVAALSSTQQSHAELWREVQDEKRKQVALVDLLGEVYGAVQKMNPANLPYLFPAHVFQPHSPTHFGADPSVSPIEIHAPAISVSPMAAHHPSQLHHPQPKLDPYQQSQLYPPQEHESSGMFASSTSAHLRQPPPRLVVDPYARSQLHSQSYSHFSAATSTPLPASPAFDSRPSTSAGAPDHHLVGLGLTHPPSSGGEDGIRRGTQEAALYRPETSMSAGSDDEGFAEETVGSMDVER